mgnify:FL=1
MIESPNAHRLQAVSSMQDIFPAYHDTPISLLLEYHNLERPFDTWDKAQVLIGMCMDNRKQLRIPDNFAYIIRSGGGNLRPSEFKVSYAIGVGGVTTIALLAHDNCGMVNVQTKREQFVSGLVENAGWTREAAEAHFNSFSPLFEIGESIDFVLSEAKRLRERYPKILVAPLFYNIADRRLALIHEE